MAVQCGITGGFTFDCTTKKNAAGGLKTTFWLFNRHQLTGTTVDADGYITALQFQAYAGLYEYSGEVNRNNATSDGAQIDGGGTNFPQSFIFTTYDTTPAQKEILQDLATANGVGVIVETSKGRFEMYGSGLGLVLESMPRSTGQSSADSTARVVTLSGNEPELEKIVFDTDYATTKALIESYVV